MRSRRGNKSPPRSPRSIHSVISAAEAVPEPDPDEIANLLGVKGDHTPTYSIDSRESTPRVVVGAKQWISRIETLEESLRCFTAFVYEDWRQKYIADGRYWQVEADYWESCYDSSFNEKCQRGQRWEVGDLLKAQQAQHNFCFFEHAAQLDWLLTYTHLASKTPALPRDEIHKSVFETTYQHHRAKYWQDLCTKQGYTHARKSIEATYYWQTEFGCLFDEAVRLEKESFETKKPAQRKRRTLHNCSAKNSARARDTGSKHPKTTSISGGTRKVYKLRDRTVGCK